MTHRPSAQGDVLYQRISTLPSDLTLVPRDKGRIVLAYGEQTGHSHSILAKEAQLSVSAQRSIEETILNVRFLNVVGGLVTLTPLSKEYNKQFDAWDVQTSEGFYRLTNDQASILEVGKTFVLDGVTLTHEEHYREVLAPGAYRVTQQREYKAAALPQRIAD